MLPRALRVTRAKNPKVTANALQRSTTKASSAKTPAGSTKYKPKPSAEQQSLAGRAGRLLGKSAAAQQKRRAGKPQQPEQRPRPIKSPEDIIFEGRRASAKDGLSFGKGTKKGKIVDLPRGARRAKEWRKKKVSK